MPAPAPRCRCSSAEPSLELPACPGSAEFRDLWVDHPLHHASTPVWRWPLDRQTERSLIASAAGVVTTSPVMSQTLEAIYGRPVETILNGFDPADYPASPPPASDPNVLRLV